MKTSPHLPLAVYALTCLFLISCTGGPENPDAAKPAAPEAKEKPSKVLFEDDMMGDWREQWFLEGKKATLEHRDEGLYFSGGTVTKAMDREEYHAHHAVLWTKQVFEGDIRITYEMTRVDTSDYGNTLLYIQAQGLGNDEYPEDISRSSPSRDISAMDKYFSYMNLISLSFRENLRCKRYPLRDENGEPYPQGVIEPIVDYIGMIPGKRYRVDVEKRAESMRLQLSDAESGEKYTDQTWDLTLIDDRIEPKTVTKGRIGLRHMSTKQFIYKDFKVERL